MFRAVYQGKAHRCIITDLNPRTNYRIRVAACIVANEESKEIMELGQWSDILTATTLDYQKIIEECVDG